MKKKEERESLKALVAEVNLQELRKSSGFKKIARALLIVALSLPILLLGKFKADEPTEVLPTTSIKLASSPVAATNVGKHTITIPTGTTNLNPFLPYRNLGDDGSDNDVPTFALVEPPQELNENSEAARVMNTTVSGILYDTFSPSAILNIEGNDYLVKKGDVVNNYKVLCIAQDSVTVKLGENTYKAGIGEILTEGTLNHNDVSNLSNKFGGAK